MRLLDELTRSLPTVGSVRRLRGKLLVHDEQPDDYAASSRDAVARLARSCSKWVA